jgi:hypothetical protein
MGDLERENRRLNDELALVQRSTESAEPLTAQSNASHSNPAVQTVQPFAAAERSPSSFFWQLDMPESGPIQPEPSTEPHAYPSEFNQERLGLARSGSIAQTSDITAGPSDRSAGQPVDMNNDQAFPTVARGPRQSSHEIVSAVDRLIHDDVGDAGEVHGPHGSYLGRGAGAMHICDDTMSVSRQVDEGKRQKGRRISNLMLLAVSEHPPPAVSKVSQPEHASRRSDGIDVLGRSRHPSSSGSSSTGTAGPFELFPIARHGQRHPAGLL